MEDMVLVIGATGKLGAPVAHQLIKDGFKVRALVRSPEKASKLLPPTVEVLRGDIADEKTLKNALQGCTIVHINLAASSLNPKAIEEAEHLGTARVVKCAVESGIQRVSYLSGGHTADEPIWKPGAHQPMTSVSKSRAEYAIRESRIPYTIFRSTMYMESVPLLIRGEKATLIGQMKRKFHLLAASDYALMVSRSLQLPEAENKVFYPRGPAAMSIPEALAVYRTILLPKLKVSSIPLGVLIAASVLPIKPLHELTNMMRHFNEAPERGDPLEADKLLGKPQTTMQEWCRHHRSNRHN